MVPQGIKRASSMFASPLPAKKPTLVGSLLTPVKKPITTQSLLPKTLPSCWCCTLIRDLFEAKIDSRYDKNNNDDQANNDNSLLEQLSNDNDILFTLLDFK